jgi:hypothetical protein
VCDTDLIVLFVLGIPLAALIAGGVTSTRQRRWLPLIVGAVTAAIALLMGLLGLGLPDE